MKTTYELNDEQIPWLCKKFNIHKTDTRLTSDKVIRLTQYDKESMVLYLPSLQWKTEDCIKIPKSHPDSIPHRCRTRGSQGWLQESLWDYQGAVRTSRQHQWLPHSPEVLCLRNATISSLEFMTLHLKNPRALHTPSQLSHSPRRPHSQSLRAMKVTD